MMVLPWPTAPIQGMAQRLIGGNGLLLNRTAVWTLLITATAMAATGYEQYCQHAEAQGSDNDHPSAQAWPDIESLC